MAALLMLYGVAGGVVVGCAVFAYTTRCAWCKGTGWCFDPSDATHVPQRCPECHLGRRL